MTRILLIPVAGTLAALCVIAWARGPRGEQPPELPPFDFPDAPEHGDETDEPTDDEPAEESGAQPPKKPLPKPLEFLLRLEADGSFFDTETETRYASIDELVERHGDARHVLVLTNGDGVDRAKLDETEVRLRDRFTVRKVYSAPETPPAEER